MLLGSIAVRGEDAGLVAFELSEANRLAFALRDGDTVLLNLAVTDRRGRELVKVIDGHVELLDDAAKFEQRPGRVRVTVPLHGRYLAQRAVDMMRVQEPEFAGDGTLTLLDIEVVEPGLARVEGIWNRGPLDAIVITGERLSFISIAPGRTEPVSLVGGGSGSVLHYTGPITTALFNMGPTDAIPGAKPPLRPPWMPT